MYFASEVRQEGYGDSAYKDQLQLLSKYLQQLVMNPR